MKKELVKYWREYLVWFRKDLELSGGDHTYPTFEGFMGWLEQTENEESSN